MFIEKILISTCLLGEPVRYDGRSVPVDHYLIRGWKAEGRLVPFCPELAGGLPVPRPPAEICGGSGSDVLEAAARVRTADGDVTRAFTAGAEAALAAAREHGIRLALLKEKSPSCGSAFIYDGSFSGRLRAGSGITMALLRKNGVRVFSENEVDALGICIKS